MLQSIRPSVFFVEDIQKSKHFYSEVLGQKIVADFGRNVGFEGGLSIWEKDYALNVIFEDKSKFIAVGVIILKYTLNVLTLRISSSNWLSSRLGLFIQLWSILGVNRRLGFMIPTGIS